MKYPLYSIRDSKGYTFDAPVMASNDFVIQRNLAEQLINGQIRIIAFAPKDFDLYKIGEFDIEKGKVTSCDPIVLVANCAEVINNYGFKKE